MPSNAGNTASDDVNVRIRTAIAFLVARDIDGCITGSCLLPDDFNTWESTPDVDVFMYTESSWVSAVSELLASDQYRPATGKDRWKWERIRTGRMSKKRWVVQTIYLKDVSTGVNINLSYKPGRDSALSVLASFDMTCVMLALDIRTQSFIDIRDSYHDLDYEPPSITDVRPNPLRLWYMSEFWDELTWSRELARILKYEGRGYRCTEVAVKMLELIHVFVNRGDEIGSPASKLRQLRMLTSVYRPCVWLLTHLGDISHQWNGLDERIFDAIERLITDLPIEEQQHLIDDLSRELEVTDDKMFMEEGEDTDEDPDDR